MCLKCWDVVCSSARAGRGEVPSKHIIGAKITSKSKQLVMMPEDHIHATLPTKPLHHVFSCITLASGHILIFPT